jgi:hypothetical protein
MLMVLNSYTKTGENADEKHDWLYLVSHNLHLL